MENEGEIRKLRKVEVPAGPEGELISPTTTSSGGFSRQGSLPKQSCLCSPTKHAGSFRCRFHRSSSFQRTKSISEETKPEATSE